MTRFSERFGFVKPRDSFQLDDMDEPLRTAIWNWLYSNFLARISNAGYNWTDSEVNYKIGTQVWKDVLKRPLDDLPETGGEFSRELRKLVESGYFYIVYEIVEAFLHPSIIKAPQYREMLVDLLNLSLETEKSGYRYVGFQLAPIVSKVEVEAISNAIDQGGRFGAAGRHIQQALTHLSDRKAPDFRNSIKEAISAVEAVCRILVEKHSLTLADALKAMESSGFQLHPAQKDGFIKLYGYTSDEKGIRHSLIDEDKLTSTDARFMLIACSAFVNFLIEKYGSVTGSPTPKK